MRKSPLRGRRILPSGSFPFGRFAPLCSGRQCLYPLAQRSRSGAALNSLLYATRPANLFAESPCYQSASQSISSATLILKRNSACSQREATVPWRCARLRAVAAKASRVAWRAITVVADRLPEPSLPSLPPLPVVPFVCEHMLGCCSVRIPLLPARD